MISPRMVPALLAASTLLFRGGEASAAVVVSTMTNNGDWQTAANWNPPQVPNNGADTYDVTLPAGRSIDMTADATVRDMTTGGTVTFNNASDRRLTIEGAFGHTSGAFTVQTALDLVFTGTAIFSGGNLDLRNGAHMANTGILEIGVPTTFIQPGLGTVQDEDLHNSGTLIVNPTGDVNLNNFRTTNTGNVAVLRQTFQSGARYRQLSGETLVHAGATLASNNFEFTGGTVRGEGTYAGSSFSLGNGTTGVTVAPGMSEGDVGTLTFLGNSNTLAGATLSYDLNGTSQGITYDHMVVPNGLNPTGATLVLNVSFTPSPSDTFDIITGNNLNNGVFANEIGGRVSFAGGNFAVTHSTGFIRLGDFQAVPEPSTLSTAGLGVFGILMFWRRRPQAA